MRTGASSASKATNPCCSSRAALGPTLITNDPHENFYTARANIYQTVYEGGRTRNVWRQAQISYERARSEREAVNVQVSGLAKEAYYDLLLAQEKRRAYEDLLKRMQSYTHRAPGATLEGIRMERELSSLARNLRGDAGLEEDQARLAYLQALNLELNTQVSLKGELTTQPVELDLQKMLAWAAQYRAELRQTEFQEELDALGIEPLAGRAHADGRVSARPTNASGHDISLDNERRLGRNVERECPALLFEFIFWLGESP